MSKSKSRNRKRSQMLRQRKKERELTEQEKESYGIPEKEKKLKVQLGRNVQVKLKDTPGEKISDLVLQMIKTLLKEARSFNEEQNIVGMGIMAWNLGVIKAEKGEKEMLKSLAGFKMSIPGEFMEIMMEYIEIKCTEYRKHKQFIFDYDYIRKDRRSNHLTVVYELFHE